MINKRLTALLALLICLAVGMGVWAVGGQIRIGKLNARIAELEDALGVSDAAIAVISSSDAVAAEFNGGVVTAAEAAGEYALISAYYEMMGMTEVEYGETAKMSVLEGLAEEKILAQKAREAGVYELSDAKKAEIEAQVRTEYEELLSYYMDFRFDDSKSEDQVRKEAESYLAESGSSYESMLESALESAWREQLYNHVTSGLTVTEEQMRSFYESQLESAQLSYSASFYAYELDSEGGRAVLWNPEGVRRVQAIEISFSADQAVEYLSLQAAVDGGDSDKQADLDALYSVLEPTAQQAYSRALSGEDFASLMAEYGASPYTNISEKSTICGDAFRDAAMSLVKPGDISTPVKTEGGMCIIQYVEDIPSGPVSYEAVRDSLLSNYEEELKSSLYNSTVVSWIQEANIRYHLNVF